MPNVTKRNLYITFAINKLRLYIVRNIIFRVNFIYKLITFNNCHNFPFCNCHYYKFVLTDMCLLLQMPHYFYPTEPCILGRISNFNKRAAILLVILPTQIFKRSSLPGSSVNITSSANEMQFTTDDCIFRRRRLCGIAIFGGENATRKWELVAILGWN